MLFTTYWIGINGNQSLRSFCPDFIWCPGNGGDVAPGLLIYLESSPKNLKDNALLVSSVKFPFAPWTVLKLNAMTSPGSSSQCRILKFSESESGSGIGRYSFLSA